MHTRQAAYGLHASRGEAITFSLNTNMTTEQIAHRLAEWVRQGQFSEARQELFAPDAISQEPDGTLCQGLEAMDQKQNQWQASFEALYGVSVSAPLVTADSFALAFAWDMAYKGQPRHTWHELGVFEVREGRVVREQFFYPR